MAHEIDQYRGYLKPGWDAADPKLKKSLKGSKPILGRGYGGPEEGWKQTSRGMHIPADLAPENKSIKIEKLMRDAIAKNPEAKTLISKLKKLIPGLTSQTVLLDLLANPGTAHAPSTASPESIEKVAQFMFENGGRWPDKSFKEGYRGDPTESLAIYRAMVEQSAQNQMAESDMKTQEKMQFYEPEQQQSFQDRSAEFLRNM
jgi:hypothetical protein